mmetsp:Transcript_1051/g.4689  ORF Transcript_1051/g.4689 Transcript_1051/m.4689 type:complete len:238 (+) Transcript_1051:2959-3672(+)
MMTMRRTRTSPTRTKPRPRRLHAISPSRPSGARSAGTRRTDAADAGPCAGATWTARPTPGPRRPGAAGAEEAAEAGELPRPPAEAEAEAEAAASHPPSVRRPLPRARVVSGSRATTRIPAASAAGSAGGRPPRLRNPRNFCGQRRVRRARSAAVPLRPCPSNPPARNPSARPPSRTSPSTSPALAATSPRPSPSSYLATAASSRARSPTRRLPRRSRRRPPRARRAWTRTRRSTRAS